MSEVSSAAGEGAYHIVGDEVHPPATGTLLEVQREPSRIRGGTLARDDAHHQTAFRV